MVVVAALVAVAPPLLFGGAWSGWIYKGLAILLIGCSCALVISVPAAIAASLSAGARRGLLLKGGAVLENLGKIRVAAFDKTGTLIEGKPQVTDVVGFGHSKAEVLKLAAALEAGSSHPLAKAILSRAAGDNVRVPQITDAKTIGGKGITGPWMAWKCSSAHRRLRATVLPSHPGRRRGSPPSTTREKPFRCW